MNYLFFIFAIILGSFNLSFAISDFETRLKAEKKVLKLEKKYIRKCKKLYKRASTDFSYIDNSEVFETTRYLDCIADYLKLDIHSMPRNKKQFDENYILTNRVEWYNQQKEAILINREDYVSKSDVGVFRKETIVEKQIIIKGSEKKGVELDDKKVTTISQAKEKCTKKGFRERSSDPLERFLFKQCVEDEGFILEDARHVNIANLKKERDFKAEAKKQKANEDKRKQNLQKKKLREEVKKPSPKPKLKPIQKIEQIKQQETVPQQEKVNREIKQDAPNVKFKTTKKIICKIDENKNKICIYDTNSKP